MRFKEYVDEAHKFEELIYPKETELENIEEDFWKICHSNSNVSSKYAADIPYNTIVSNENKSLIKSFLEEYNYWSLSTIHYETNSLFQFLKEEKNSQISGLTLPWIYSGMLFSTFCWHVEDLYMYSLNYMYYGKPKIWYSVSHKEKEKLDLFIKNKNLTIKNDKDNILHQLILMVDPKELIENGIKIFRTIQNPGELIFTLPKAYHAGFSIGFNISEAVNLAVIFKFIICSLKIGSTMDSQQLMII